MAEPATVRSATFRGAIVPEGALRRRRMCWSVGKQRVDGSDRASRAGGDRESADGRVPVRPLPYLPLASSRSWARLARAQARLFGEVLRDSMILRIARR